MTLRALVVDDERLARRALICLLGEAHPDVSVVAEAADVASAALAIREHKPDLVFLDIQMPGGDGFSLFDQIEVTAKVIFVTAYDQYALRAFEVNALDYLVKPVSPERLARSLDRVRTAQPEPTEPTAPLSPDDLLCLTTARGLCLFRVRDLTHLLAADDYVEVHTTTRPMVLSDMPLRKWEERLPMGFLRVHRGAIVHLDHVESVVRSGDSYEVHLRSGTIVPMSRRYAARLTGELGPLSRPTERP